MSFFNRLQQNTIAWLKAIFSGSHAAKNCHMDVGARLMPEAVIDNFSGNRNDISIGKNSYIRGHLLTYGHGGRIAIGDWCYIGVRSTLWSMASVTIGNRVLIAHDVNIHDGTAHSLDAKQRHLHFRRIIETGHPVLPDDLPGIKSAPIVIEDDVWISFGVTILRGVTIGQRSVIAAGAIVTRDVPADTIYRCQVNPLLTPIDSLLATDSDKAQK